MSRVRANVVGRTTKERLMDGKLPFDWQKQIRDYQVEVGTWALANFGDQDSYRPLLGMMEELGELTHAHLKTLQGVRISEDHREKKKDALGDILIYMLHYCELEAIDLQRVLHEVWEEVRKRNWKKDPVKGGVG